MDQEKTSQEDARREQYKTLRDEFNNMSLDDRAMFLIEAAFTTVAKAVDEAGHQVAEMVSRVKEACREQAAKEQSEEPENPPGSASPSMN